MSERHPFFLFRGGSFLRGFNTRYSPPPLNLVISVYGGGKGEGGRRQRRVR